MRLLPGFRQQTSKLPGVRHNLCAKVRLAVKKYGPSLGALYYEKSNAREATIKRSAPSSEDLTHGSAAATASDSQTEQTKKEK